MKTLIALITYFGIVNTSVADIFSKADYESPLETQELMGTPVRILQREGMWIQVESSQPYTGWMPALCITTVNDNGLKAWNDRSKYTVTAFAGQVFSKPDSASETVCDIVAGDEMAVLTRGGKAVRKKGFAGVILPDGTQGWVRQECIEAKDALETRIAAMSGQEKIETVIRWALKMKNIPYLWGGMSPKGFDCSGLTRYCYLMAGVKLPRNASQQVRIGKQVEIPKDASGKADLSRIRRGDLVFFGTNGRITHVGLYLGEGRMVHSSHVVRVNSLIPGRDDYYENSWKIASACRIVE